MDVSDASATGIIDRMEKRGLVERRHDTGDRRKVLVHATEAGFDVFREMAEHRRRMLATVLDELTREEMASLLVGYRAITAARVRVIEREATRHSATDQSRSDGSPGDAVEHPAPAGPAAV
jgi:DNA-binding MarR family transcriptional regulator